MVELMGKDSQSHTSSSFSEEPAVKFWRCELQLLPVLRDVLPGFWDGGKGGDKLRVQSLSLTSLFRLCLLRGET